MNFKNIPNNKSAKGYGSYLTNFDNVINQKYTYDPNHSMNIITALDIDWCGAELPNSNIDNGGSLTIETTEQLLTLINNMNIKTTGLKNNINDLQNATTELNNRINMQSGTSGHLSSLINNLNTEITKLNSKIDYLQYKIYDLHHDSRPLDILYANSNGDKLIVNTILDPNLGYTPIALCVARSNFFGVNEPARWMSLKYMTSDGIGALKLSDVTKFKWCAGTYSTYVTTINAQRPCKDLTWPNSDEIDFQKVPSLIDTNGNWNLTELGEVNQYGLTNITGKSNTDGIINNSGDTIYAAGACSMYHTVGTEIGDWYLGAAGEMSMIFYQYDNINAKLAEIAAIYPNDCFSSLALDNALDNYWTSTSAYNYREYVFNTNVTIKARFFTESNEALAMLSY